MLWSVSSPRILAFLAALCTSTLVGCADPTPSPIDAGLADAAPSDAAPSDARVDASAALDGASSDAMVVLDAGGLDASSLDGAAPDAGDSNAPCSFNSDCANAWERCECTEADGCMCKAGPRGTGRAGSDGCTSGNDCASALCVEGWPAGTSYCSGPCTTVGRGDPTCVDHLPICADIAFVGRVCIRDPNGH